MLRGAFWNLFQLFYENGTNILEYDFYYYSWVPIYETFFGGVLREKVSYIGTSLISFLNLPIASKSRIFEY